MEPGEVVQDMVFFTALLTSMADVSISIGGDVKDGTWANTPVTGGAGLYHGSAPFDGRTGTVVISVSREDTIILQQTGKSISTTCQSDISNWNAWTGSVTGHPLPAPVEVESSGSSTTVVATTLARK